MGALDRFVGCMSAPISDLSALPRVAGIYALLNTANGRAYVGSTKCLVRRATDHRRDLFADKHGNARLQASWRKHGSDAFKVVVLELCDEPKLIEREQHYIDLFRATERERGFNIQPFAGRTTMTQEIRRKLSESCRRDEGVTARMRQLAAKRVGVKLSAEHRAKMSLAHIGRQSAPVSDSTRANISAAEGWRSGIAAMKTPTALANLSDALKSSAKAIAQRVRLADSKKGIQRSEEVRRKISETKRARAAATRRGEV